MFYKGSNPFLSAKFCRANKRDKTSDFSRPSRIGTGVLLYYISFGSSSKLTAKPKNLV